MIGRHHKSSGSDRAGCVQIEVIRVVLRLAQLRVTVHLRRWPSPSIRVPAHSYKLRISWFFISGVFQTLLKRSGESFFFSSSYTWFSWSQVEISGMIIYFLGNFHLLALLLINLHSIVIKIHRRRLLNSYTLSYCLLVATTIEWFKSRSLKCLIWLQILCEAFILVLAHLSKGWDGTDSISLILVVILNSIHDFSNQSILNFQQFKHILLYQHFKSVIWRYFNQLSRSHRWVRSSKVRSWSSWQFQNLLNNTGLDLLLISE